MSLVRGALLLCLGLACCLGVQHHERGGAPLTLDPAELQQQIEAVNQLDEQAEMLTVHTDQTIGDFAAVVSSQISVDDVRSKYDNKKRALQELVSAMNTSVDKCEDFYSYSCGAWLNHTEIPSDTSRWSRTFSTIHRNNMDVLRGILNGTQDDQYPPTKVKGEKVSKVRMFYDSCTNVTRRHASGVDGLRSFKERVIQASTHEELVELMAELEMEGLSVTPFSFGVGSDDKNPGMNVAFAGQGGLGLPDISYYAEHASARILEVRAKYTTLLDELFKLVGHEGDAAAVLAFESRLAGVMLTREQRRDPIKMYNPSTMANFTRDFQFMKPFVKVIGDKFDGYEGSSKLVLENRGYYANLSLMLNSTGGEPIEALQSYVLSKVLLELVPHTSMEAGGLVFGFYGAALHGVKDRPALWKRCVSITQDYLWQISDQLFLERSFSGQSGPIANVLLDHVKAAFGELLEDNAWMDAPTKEEARRKLDAMGRKVGSPVHWESYDDMDVRADYLHNVLQGNTHQAAKHYSKMNKKVDRLRWGMHASTVNAYYSPNMNEMAFPAGILQPPFFSKDAPMVLNFGSIGAVMGHELTHGFDDQGALYNANGAMHNWWSAASQQNFEGRTRCFAKQYEGFGLPEISATAHVNGKLTLGENLADNGGVALALRAYKTWRVQNGGPSMFNVHGKLYSDEHLFWVAYAQTWCAKQTPKAMAQQVLTDPHSPGRLRVLGPVQNTERFSALFKCGEGAAMNPAHKCMLWEG